MEVKKVLLIEDYEPLMKMMKNMIETVFGDIEILVTNSLDEAEELYQNHTHDLDAIFIDTRLKEKSTEKLQERISLEFNRPLVKLLTTGGESKSQGNSHECDKSQLLKFLIEWKRKHCG